VRIIALMTVRNEAMYLGVTLPHLFEQGVEVCLVDNESTDDTVRVASQFLGKGLIRVESLPFRGCFELTRILENEERLARELEADWFIHHDADEIREACSPYASLAKGIAAADDAGFTAVGFDEFVFLPVAGSGRSFEGTDFRSAMEHYYYFRPRPRHQLNAWKKSASEVDLLSNAGHCVEFEGRHIFPESFVLRHYPALSRAHLMIKYASRVFDRRESEERGWNQDRAWAFPDDFRLPRAEEMQRLSGEGPLSKSNPRTRHLFIVRDEPPAWRRALPSWLRRMTASRPRGRATDDFEAPHVVLQGDSRSGVDRVAAVLDDEADLAILPADTTATSSARSGSTSPARRLAEEAHRHALDAGKHRWGLVCPEPVWLRSLVRAGSETNLVHVVRDGRHVAAEEAGAISGEETDIVERAAHWLAGIANARQVGQRCRTFHEMRFEDLLEHPERTLQALREALGLNSDRRFVVGASLDVQSSKPLAPDDLEQFNAVAGPMLRELGYEVT